MTLDELCSKLDGVTGFAHNRKAKCPGHEDDVASLSLKETPDGRILLSCKAGCSFDAVVKALGITAADIRGNGGNEVARYAYRNTVGDVAYEKVRYEPKTFRFEPSGYKGARFPYHLPELLAAGNRRILFVEGEKDVETLERAGFIATTAGAVNDWKDEMAEHFRGRYVTVIPDNDGPGREHAKKVATALVGVAKEVRTLDLPSVPSKGDVSDFLKTRTADDLRKALATAPIFDAARTDGRLLSAIKSKPVEFLWFPRIPNVGLTFVFGEAGIGKSTFAIDILSRLSRGDVMPMGCERSEPRRIVACGFEDDIEGTVAARFHSAGADGDMILIETPGDYPNPAEPLIPKQLDWLRSEIRKHNATVLFIDNIENALTGSLDSNNSLSIRSALAPLVEVAQSMGVAVIALHHPKKGYLNVSAKEGMTGSQAYTNIARATLEALEVPGQKDLYALAAVKVNGYPRSIRTLTYRLRGDVTGLRDGAETFETATVAWSDETELTADEMHREHVRLARETEELRLRPKTLECRTFLQALDMTGGRTWADVVAEGDVRGFPEISLRRARAGILEFRDDKLWHATSTHYEEGELKEHVSTMSTGSTETPLVEEGMVAKNGASAPAQSTEDREKIFNDTESVEEFFDRMKGGQA